MSTSWRIAVNEIDKTQTVGTSPEKTCATAIRSAKGSKEWVFYDKGLTQSILNYYGYPSSTYPDVQDAIDANNHSGIWLCAPYKNGTYGGVIVTKNGTIPLTSGTTTQSITSYSGIQMGYTLFTGNSSKVLYSGLLTNYSYYNAQSLGLNYNGSSIITNTTISGNYEVYTMSGYGTGRLNTTNGSLTFTFNSAPTTGTVISTSYTINVSNDAYFTLFNYNEQADDIQVEVTANTTISGAFDIAVQRYDVSVADWIDLENSPYTVGLTTDSVDGNGTNIYIGNIFNEDAQLFVPTIQNSTVSTYTDDSTYVALGGGSRGDTLVGSDLVTYYELLKDTSKYATNLIFDATAEASVASEFQTLRAYNDQILKHTTFILPTANISADTIISSPATARNSVANRGIFYYCLTWGLRTDKYQSNNFACSNIGLIAAQILESMINDPSQQPMYFNEQGNMGGQVDSGIIKLYQSATQSQLQKLDGYHFNPLVKDPQYGYWIVGARTTLQKESVWSYVAQSIETDLIVRDVMTNVLIPQQGKANDDYHRITAKTNTDTIVSNYINGIDSFASKCDRTNNSDAILNQQKFILSLAVQYKSYSMQIIFNFINTPHGTDVSEALN
jgi:hypothetical protein